MYEQFYGFGERPFSLLPDPDFLYPGAGHAAALDMLELSIFNHSGFCVVSGEIGAGKTTLIRELLNRLDSGIRVGLVSNTHPSFGELLQWISAAFGLPLDGADALELHRRFIDFIIAEYAHNRRTLLIVDEAQNLTFDALEELRMLSNINSDKDFVLQVVLVGQPQLRDKLRDPRLRQFAQRVALDYHLGALDADDTAQYIRHRLRHAGGDPGLFSDAACRSVARHTGGIPRLINRLCDLALVYGYSEQRRRIDAGLIEQVADDGHPGPAQTVQMPQAGNAAAVDTRAQASRQSAAPPRPASANAAHPHPAPRTKALPPELLPARATEPPTPSAGLPAAGPESPAAGDEREYPPVKGGTRNLRKGRRIARVAVWLALLFAAGAVAGNWLPQDRWSRLAGSSLRQFVGVAISAGQAWQVGEGIWRPR